MSSQLQIAEVSKSFGGVQAVSRVGLDVQQGEILSVIGPNGAGKTTLLNMISGFYHPDSGRIMLEGVDISRCAPSRVAELGVARTFQNIALFRGMTVLDNLRTRSWITPLDSALSPLLLSLFALAPALLYPRCSPRQGLLVASAVVALIVITPVALLLGLQIWFAPAPALLAAASIGTIF